MRGTKFAIAMMGSFALGLAMSGGVRAESKQEIDVAVADSLQKFTGANPAHAELVRKAAGILVFPRITKAGAGIGGEHGDGALLKGGVITEYYGLSSASVGLTLGAGQRTEIVLFMTREALEKFEASKGYDLGVDAQIAVVSKGAGGSYDSDSLRKPILGFVFDEKGLIGDVSLKGSKIKRIKRDA